MVKQLNSQNIYMKQVILFWDNIGSILKNILLKANRTSVLHKCLSFVLQSDSSLGTLSLYISLFFIVLFQIQELVEMAFSVTIIIPNRIIGRY